MQNLNNVCLSGTLLTDAAVVQQEDGQAEARFKLRYNYKKPNGDGEYVKATYDYPVMSQSKYILTVAQRGGLKKGAKVTVEGIVGQVYTNRNGERVPTEVVEARSIDVVKPAKNGEDAQEQKVAAPAPELADNDLGPGEAIYDGEE